MKRFAIAGALLALFVSVAPAQTAVSTDNSPHTTQFVSVEKNVKLEVLDWGGTGFPLFFLAGFGNTAHAFDDFAPRFTSKHHVYGITRRGFGQSSKPAPTLENYDPNRLGDDILAVASALRMNKPILVGHSLAGEELSSIGSRHPEKVAGLIYLDAAYHYAFFDPKTDILYPYAATMLRDLARLPSVNPTEARTLIAEMRENVPGLLKGMEWYQRALVAEPDLPQQRLNEQRRLIQNAVVATERKYAKVGVPMLALFAVPHECHSNCDSPQLKASDAADIAQANFVESNNPTGRVVRLSGANHFIFRSNPAEVEREMNAFLEGLPR